jgi:hypothetical protein
MNVIRATVLAQHRGDFLVDHERGPHGRDSGGADMLSG